MNTLKKRDNSELDKLLGYKIASLIEECVNDKVKQLTSLDSQTINTNNQKTLNPLTKREKEVLYLVSEGMSNTEISKELYISKSTAKAHVHSILQKLYAKNRAIATKIGVKEGLIA